MESVKSKLLHMHALRISRSLAYAVVQTVSHTLVLIFDAMVVYQTFIVLTLTHFAVMHT
jgi:hypothetical protein